MGKLCQQSLLLPSLTYIVDFVIDLKFADVNKISRRQTAAGRKP
jgi:hypothetical protein